MGRGLPKRDGQGTLVAGGGSFVGDDEDFARRRVAESFARQGLMRTLGAELRYVAPGQVEVSLTPRAEVAQQHGFVHGGAVVAVADSAAGYSALSLMPRGRGVLTTELKINFVAPAAGERIVARGRVVKAGRTLSLVQTEVFAEQGGRGKLVALLTATMMTVEGRDGVED